MRKIRIITDTHFGHSNMIQYCRRPVAFSEIILSNLIKEYKPGDIMIHLGDICIGSDAYWHRKLVESTPGVKRILVRGNHDKKSDSWYMDHGWDFVCENFVMYYSGKKIVFSHQPTILARNDINIHGHFHNHLNRLLSREWAVEGEEERNHYVLNDLTVNHVNISMEESNYHPVLLSKALAMRERQIKEWINK